MERSLPTTSEKQMCVCKKRGFFSGAWGAWGVTDHKVSTFASFIFSCRSKIFQIRYSSQQSHSNNLPEVPVTQKSIAVICSFCSINIWHEWLYVREGKRAALLSAEEGWGRGVTQGTIGPGNLSNGFLTLFMARSLSLSGRYQFFEAPRMKHARDRVKVKKERGRKTDRDAETVRERVWEVSVKGSRQETAILTLRVWYIDFSCLDES